MQLAALTRLFSATVFRELCRYGKSRVFARLVDLTDLAAGGGVGVTVGDAFDLAFEKLKAAGNRDEYIYRSAVAHKILLGTHSLRTASMLNEFRAGSSRADLVILNGTATVYEIKSERDSLKRLAAQVENYKRVFAKVNVIASEAHVQSVMSEVGNDVGVLCLSRRYQISTEREGSDCPERIQPLTVLDSLRSVEAIEILRALGVPVPDVPNTRRNEMLKSKFRDLDPAALHFEMVRTLKRTRNLAPLSDLVTKLPISLQAGALATQVRRSDHTRLLSAIETPLKTAMAWR